MPIKEPIQAHCIVTPTAATPNTFPSNNSVVVTDERSTSMRRFDFSSMVLLSNIWAIVKIATQSM